MGENRGTFLSLSNLPLLPTCRQLWPTLHVPLKSTATLKRRNGYICLLAAMCEAKQIVQPHLLWISMLNRTRNSVRITK